jgi:hypothetical protein
MNSDFEPAANSEGQVENSPTSYLVFHNTVPGENFRRTVSADAGKTNGASSRQKPGDTKGLVKETGWQTAKSHRPPSKEPGGRKSPLKPPAQQLRAAEPDSTAPAPPPPPPPSKALLNKHNKSAHSFRRALVDSAALDAIEASSSRSRCYEAQFAARPADAHAPGAPE